MRRFFHPNLLAVAAIIVAVILYGTLFPFRLRERSGDAGPLWTVLGSWAEIPDRGDFLANIVLYLPLGFFLLAAMRPTLSLKRRVLLTILIGFVLSFGVELLQYYLPRRPAARDVYANTLGTAIGAFGAAFFGGIKLPLLQRALGKPFPVLILAAFLGYRLFPFIPTTDLHKYWNALKPLVLTPTLPAYELFHLTVSWLVVCALLEAIFGRHRWPNLFLAFVAVVLAAKVGVIGRVLSWAEIAGAAAAFLLWFPLLGVQEKVRAVILAVLLGAYVLSWRLEPFEFGDRAGAFGWVPFLSFLRGSVIINVLSFFEKMFHYGALLWLTTVAGMRLRTAAIFVALLVLGTSLAEIYLPGRSAEATDAVMVLIVAGMVALLTPASGRLGARAEAPARGS